MAANMYRVGDYVYFETSSTTPYQIRRIEELNKTPNGNVEAKVMCFYRRRDISSSLIQLADKHQSALEDEQESDDEIAEKERHQLKHRELFLSRQVETLPATHIRGKCCVTLLNETESLLSYLNKEDTFFYSLVYDPQQKTLLADKGEIRVGSKFQVEKITLKMTPEEYENDRKGEKLEELVWNPENGSSDKQIDQFMVIARSVGTFARALDCSSTVRQPSLHMSAAAASRDVTLFHAMDTLHKSTYVIHDAVASLVPTGGPVLCRDEMEEWSASEANLFEEALDKYGKDFNDIRQDFLPWKTLKSIVEYYYMWKTTDRYVQQKRIKAAEQESKLKQVYIPNYNKPNPAAIMNSKGSDLLSGRACESCYAASSHQWYSWGPVHMQCRLCAACWMYWKKCGGLKMPTRLANAQYSDVVSVNGSNGSKSEILSDGERPPPTQRNGHREIRSDAERLAHMAALRTHRCTISGCGREFKLKSHLARHLATAHGLAVRAGSPRPVMKTRAAFCLITTPLTRLSRRICRDILRIRHAARNPFQAINITSIKQECQLRLANGDQAEAMKNRERGLMESVSSRLGIDTNQEKPPLLSREGVRKPAEVLLFPAPAEQPKPTMRSCDSPPPRVTAGQPTIMKKRGYEQTNGVENGPPAKRPSIGVIRQAGSLNKTHQQGGYGPLLNHQGMNGRGPRTMMGKPPQKKPVNWVDAPDDVYFVSTEATRKLRKQLTNQDFRRAARKPWMKILYKGSQEAVVVLD
ncbi:metastasis-associated protein MTA3-like isoform X3 [Tubulanus polymorphus]|uniref:metastasis-associated protein MTA3-like isoform X3 n=1 Tax=Tubulanus polymorphus TaxID=672921 RepID=UPI003DA3F3FF